MNFTGKIKKMGVKLSHTVDYFFNIDDESFQINEYLGKVVEIKNLGKIYCKSCNKLTKKSFFQGFCYNCFINSPSASECILHPELCKAHEGISRDMEWSKINCLCKQYVYFAISSNLKVGVTKENQIPIRWIDQGAIKGIIFAQTPNRYLAGMIELELKKSYSDKSSWQKLLKGETSAENLINIKKEAFQKIPEEYKKYYVENNDITEINYPVLYYPEKIKSINLDRTSYFKGKLIGIKGQYLIFEDGFVINIRKYTGYEISITF